jgi:DnaJ-class molecular chaperone
MPKVKVIKKERTSPCGRCHKTIGGIAGKRKGCCSCGGTGKYKDHHYIMIVGNLALDMDFIK